jgi:hypothetical protein
MNSKFARLRIAALFCLACTVSTAFAVDPDRTVRLSWTSPTQNDDGSPLTDLQGYYIYVGLTPEALAIRYFTNDPSALVGTGPVPLYFAVTAVNTSGLESVLSEVVSLPVQGPQ